MLRTLRRITGFFQRAMKAYNRRMGKVYSPRTAALTGTAIVLVMILTVLFLVASLFVVISGIFGTCVLNPTRFNRLAEE